MLIDREDVKK
jgi:hypothetical protein